MIKGSDMKLKIHMKSGKTLVQRGVKEYNFKYTSNEVIGINIELKWWAKFSVLVGTLALDQIEAITRH